MAFAIYAIIVLFGIIFRKSKIQSAIMYAYIFVMIGFNMYSSDYANNLFMYNNINSGLYALYEPGYGFLMQVCNDIGASFTFFRCIVAVISLFFIRVSLKRMSNNENVVLSCLILYPIILFASGLRGFIGFGISLYAFSVLFTKKKWHKQEFIILIIIATFFHYEYIFNLSFLALGSRMSKNTKLRLLAIELIVFILYFTGTLYSVAGRYIHNGKVLQWLNYSNYEHPSLIMDILIVFVFLFLFYKINCNLKHSLISDANSENIDNVHLQQVLTFLVFMIPLLFMNYTFERLFEIPIVLLIILTSNHKENDNQGRFVLTTREDVTPVIVSLVMGFLFSVLIHKNLLTDIILNNLYIR